MFLWSFTDCSKTLFPLYLWLFAMSNDGRKMKQCRERSRKTSTTVDIHDIIYMGNQLEGPHTFRNEAAVLSKQSISLSSKKAKR